MKTLGGPKKSPKLFRPPRPYTLIPKLQKVLPTWSYQNLLFYRIPINPILGFIIGTYKKVGFSRSR